MSIEPRTPCRTHWSSPGETSSWPMGTNSTRGYAGDVCIAQATRDNGIGSSTFGCCPSTGRGGSGTRVEIRDPGTVYGTTRSNGRSCSLHHFVGYSSIEIAETLGIPPGTARSRLHNAHRAMRAALEADVPTRRHGRRHSINPNRGTAIACSTSGLTTAQWKSPTASWGRQDPIEHKNQRPTVLPRLEVLNAHSGHVRARRRRRCRRGRRRLQPAPARPSSAARPTQSTSRPVGPLPSPTAAGLRPGWSDPAAPGSKNVGGDLVQHVHEGDWTAQPTGTDRYSWQLLPAGDGTGVRVRST